MAFLRSLLFNIVFWVWSACLLPLLAPIRLIPGRLLIPPAPIWSRGVIWICKWVAGIDYEVRGRENIPDGRVLFASKHQSAWETITINTFLPNAAPIVKQELLKIPVYGPLAARSGVIPVDRKAGARAVKDMIAGARARLAAGRDILIFPEGTRTAPGKRIPYQPGVAALYRMLGIPVVPIALNSGVFWGRRRFIKRPGRIVVEFLPPIPPGLDRKTFIAELEERIETASDRLIAEARRGENAGSPLRTPCTPR